MFHLRVYTDRAGGGAPGAGGVFYSQRGGGPHYRWSLEGGVRGQWHVTRLHPAEWNPKALSQLSQTDMPAALRARLADHYMW